MDSGMFYGIQKGAIAALNCDKSWFEDQNKIYRRRRELTEKLAEKLGCEVYAAGVGLLSGRNCRKESNQQKSSLTKYYTRNTFS